MSRPRRDRPPVVTIDGPAGSGKSSVAKAVADRLGVPHVDTGAYYRAATLAVLRTGSTPADDDDLHMIAVVQEAAIDRVHARTILDDHDVEEEIRSDRVTAQVSAVARVKPIRDHLLTAQQAGLARDGGVIEGRDAGTRVAPDADLKVWLDADIDERARRRAEQAGEDDRVAFHVADLDRRDKADAAQMARDPEAIQIDTTGLTQDEVIDAVIGLLRGDSGDDRTR